MNYYMNTTFAYTYVMYAHVLFFFRDEGILSANRLFTLLVDTYMFVL